MLCEKMMLMTQSSQMKEDMQLEIWTVEKGARPLSEMVESPLRLLPVFCKTW